MLGSGALRAIVFRATCFFVLEILVFLSPIVNISLLGVIFIEEMFLHLVAFLFRFCIVEWSD